jgi:hypothetical protein
MALELQMGFFDSITSFVGDLFNPSNIVKNPLKSALIVDPGVAVFSGGSYIYDKFQEAMPKAPEVPPLQSAVDNSAGISAAEAARVEAISARKRAGLKSSILTGPQGVTIPADTFKTTLG